MRADGPPRLDAASASPPDRSPLGVAGTRDRFRSLARHTGVGPDAHCQARRGGRGKMKAREGAVYQRLLAPLAVKCATVYTMAWSGSDQVLLMEDLGSVHACRAAPTDGCTRPRARPSRTTISTETISWQLTTASSRLTGAMPSSRRTSGICTLCSAMRRVTVWRSPRRTVPTSPATRSPTARGTSRWDASPS